MADSDVPLELLTQAQSMWGFGREDLTVERLGVLCVGLAEEVHRLDRELRALADVLVGDHRFAVEYEPSNLAGRRSNEQGNSEFDGGVPGPIGAATIADHHARI